MNLAADNIVSEPNRTKPKSRRSRYLSIDCCSTAAIAAVKIGLGDESKWQRQSEKLRRTKTRRDYLKRGFDVFLSIIALLVFSIPILLLFLLVSITTEGSALYWSDRVGKSNKIFRMPKLRTMHDGSPEVATHLLENPDLYLTQIGRFLRKTSLDEFPQIWSILVGDMSFVGPRPALFNQNDLIELRNRVGLAKLTSGLTGWAQINGRDRLSIPKKVEFDTEYMQIQSFWFDLRILFLTIANVLILED